MKTKIFTTLLLTLLITGCQKQPEQATASHNTDPEAKAQFEKSDAIINKYLDQLESPNTTIEEKTRILCKDYPTEYKTNYMPALLRLAAKDYTRSQLLEDLDIALDYYKKKDNVQC
ncbi:hypothetical protein B9T29_06200 [Acinetobacter sp. ANC 3903]|uniref:hypothetical protein n=1 Tax=Acinetobacter sp. ANC 3903 TaxID=1977883 RepID=UPI000A359443|nr:hypothetical protein [Acinetobacter sp. ANC 3903]OTG62809.1 hypothetical protein B9T29_06200 [Acinetobacter sp. ANC 3903]